MDDTAEPTGPVSATAAAPRPWARWWQALGERERLWVMFAALLVGAAMLWLLALAPALRTLTRAPAQIDAVDAQLQTMQRLAAEARELRSVTPVTAEQAAAALKSASDRLGDKARLVMQGDRATLSLSGVSAAALRDWLAEVRSGARARPVEASLTRGAAGLSGTLVVAIGGAS
jgi:general secretion pathway protein M